MGICGKSEAGGEGKNDEIDLSDGLIPIFSVDGFGVESGGVDVSRKCGQGYVKHGRPL